MSIFIGTGHLSLKPFLCISKVLLVDGLNHNLLNISQLCNNSCDVVFGKNKFIINKHNDIHIFTVKKQKIK